MYTDNQQTNIEDQPEMRRAKQKETQTKPLKAEISRATKSLKHRKSLGCDHM